MDFTGAIPPEVKPDERQLLLFWALHVPMTIAQMADRGFLGDPGLLPDSYERTFRRICKDFADNGVHLETLSIGGEVHYRVDRAATYIDGTIPTQDELLKLVLLVGTYLDGSFEGLGDGHAGGPYLDCLRRARDKLACTTRGFQLGGAMPRPCSEADMKGYTQLIESYINRCGVEFPYTDSSGRSSVRSVDLYGVFRHDGHLFFVGRDATRDDLRVFRDDRIDLPGVKPLSRGFEVPEDFCIESFEGLPFEYGPDAVEAVFVRTAPAKSAATVTSHRGSWVGDEWHVTVRNVGAAAAWSCDALSEGIKPREPHQLAELLRAGLTKVVDMHG